MNQINLFQSMLATLVMQKTKKPERRNKTTLCSWLTNSDGILENMSLNYQENLESFHSTTKKFSKRELPVGFVSYRSKPETLEFWI